MPRNYKNQKPINRFNFCRWFEDKNTVNNWELELGSGNNFTNWTKTIPTHTNLLSYCQEFSNSVYNKVSGLTIGENVIINPDGELKGDSFIAPVGVGVPRVERNFSAINNQDYTLSIRSRKEEAKWVYFYFFADNGVFLDAQVWFNVETGVVGTVDAGLTASIVDEGNGWYRCIATQKAQATALGYVGVGMSDDNSTLIFTGTGVERIYMDGIQLQPYHKATKLIYTLSAPVTADDGEIISATRTNLFLNNLDFNSGSWGGTGSYTYTPNQLGPFGLNTAQKIEVFNSTPAIIAQGVTLTQKRRCCYSFGIKKGNVANRLNQINIYNNTGGFDVFGGVINLDTNEITVTINPYNAIVESIEINNEWAIVYVSFISGFALGDLVSFYVCFAGGTLTIGDNVFIDTPMLEYAEYPSFNRIATTSTAVTVQDGINASRAVRLNRGVTEGLAFNAGSVFDAAGKYKIEFWAKTASESTSVKIISDVSTFDEFEITNKEYQKYILEVDAVASDNQIRFFNTTENSSLILDNVRVDFIQEDNSYEIPNPYPLDKDTMYMPLLVNGDKFRFYINSDNPLTGLTFINLRLALYNEWGIRMYSDANINQITVGAGINIYSNDLTLSLSNYPEGKYYWALIDVNTGTTKYTSNYFYLVHSGYNDYSCHIEYKNYKDLFKFKYTDALSAFSNKFRIHLLMKDELPGGDIDQYQEVSTGSFRNYSRLDERIIKCETYYFDREAHQAMDALCKHSVVSINSKQYLAKGNYAYNTEQISNVSKGEVEFIDQEYSQINN